MLSLPALPGHTGTCSPARHTTVYGHRVGQTHPQLLYGEKTKLGNLGRKVLALELVLAGGKEKEPSHACEVVMEKTEPGPSRDGRASAGTGEVRSRYKEKHFPHEESPAARRLPGEVVPAPSLEVCRIKP